MRHEQVRWIRRHAEEHFDPESERWREALKPRRAREQDNDRHHERSLSRRTQCVQVRSRTYARRAQRREHHERNDHQGIQDHPHHGHAGRSRSRPEPERHGHDEGRRDGCPHAAARVAGRDEHLVEQRNERAHHGAERQQLQRNDRRPPPLTKYDRDHVAGHQCEPDRDGKEQERQRLRATTNIPLEFRTIRLHGREDTRSHAIDQLVQAVERKRRHGERHRVEAERFGAEHVRDEVGVSGAVDVPAEAPQHDMPADTQRSPDLRESAGRSELRTLHGNRDECRRHAP